MKDFRERYLAGREAEPLFIADLGSTDIGGSYRQFFDSPAWRYCGLDLAPGPNVDVVMRDPYRWSELASGSVDLFVSGQVFEHVEYFWITMLELSRVLRPGGMACIVAPSGGPEHRYPVDCWRFYPDGMKAMARFARLEVLEAVTHWDDFGDPGSDPWHDSVLVLRKPRRALLKGLLVAILQKIQATVLRAGLRSAPEFSLTR